jgi:arabinogalactan oligomer/maltooligosaccharide transport system substrate-binding protein
MMMGHSQPQRLGPIPKPFRLIALLMAAVLGGCSLSKPTLPVMLYLAVSIEDDRQITSETALEFRKRFYNVVQQFRSLHPEVLVQTALYSERDLTEQLRRRNKTGLGPDLILTSGEMANALLAAGLVDPLPETPESKANTLPMLRLRLRNHRGQQSAQPLLVFPQLACFDRRQVQSTPTTLRDLLSAGAEGDPVGLSLNFRQLVWTAGALGAIPGLVTAVEGQPPSPAQQQGILNWLSWLQDANNQQRINFYPDQSTLRQGLAAGRLAWVTCSSSELQQLRQRMGAHLGVSALPNGEAHQASPLNRLRVLALGRNSSPRQRQMALALTQFSITPLLQRNLTLESLSLLPVNPHVNVPVQSSQVLTALVQAKEQAANSAPLLSHLHSDDPRVAQLEAVLVPLVFGVITPEMARDQVIAVLRRTR